MKITAMWKWNEKNRLLFLLLFFFLLLQDMAADGELLLIRISPDKDGKFGFNVKVSVLCYSYVCVCV